MKDQNLFTHGINQPLAERMRPRTLDQIAGQTHLVGPDKPLSALIMADTIPSMTPVSTRQVLTAAVPVFECVT